MGKEATFQDFSAGSPPDGQNLWRWLYVELRAAILDGRLKAGARMPSTRSLASECSISSNVRHPYISPILSRLERQIKKSAFERTMLSDLKLAALLRVVPENVVGVFKDSYMLDFLDLSETHSEADLQAGLLLNLRKFLMELGDGFAFVGEKVRVQVDDLFGVALEANTEFSGIDRLWQRQPAAGFRSRIRHSFSIMF